MRETTALGAAFAAGYAIGIWKDFETIRNLRVQGADIFRTRLDVKEREARFAMWQEAVQRSMGWTDVYSKDD